MNDAFVPLPLVHTISLEYFHTHASDAGLVAQVVFPNFTIFGVFCSSLYAVSGVVVALVQLSKSPVRRTPTFTFPQSKH